MYGTFSFLDSRKFDMGQFSIPMKYNFIKFPISDQARPTRMSRNIL